MGNVVGSVRSVVGVRWMASEALKRTALYDVHVASGATMVPFAGYSMPVQYKDGIKDSHLFVRASAGLFDVSHMGQIRFHGKDRVAFLEKLVVADVATLAENHATLSVITVPSGGIVDDTIITNMGEYLGLVINGACKEKDLKHFQAHLQEAKSSGMDVDLEVLEDRELLALQGPKAMEALESLKPTGGPELAKMPFMTAATMSVLGESMLVSRCGYTGEDGFEISVPRSRVRQLFEALTEMPTVKPAGLGARDSLRMEAGLCLYGNDIDEETTPIEAGLTFTVGKRRRESGGFLGSEVILDQINNGVTRRRVGFVVEKGAPSRGGESIKTPDGQVVGKVTSGGFGPSVGKPIGMGYCNKPFNKSGTELLVEVRGKSNPIVITKMPLVPTKYYKVPS